MTRYFDKLKLLAVGIGLVACFSACSRIAPGGNGAGYEGFVGPQAPDVVNGTGVGSGTNSGVFMPIGNSIAVCHGGGYTIQVTPTSLQITTESGAVVTESATLSATPSGFTVVSTDATLEVTSSVAPSTSTGTLTLTSPQKSGDGGQVSVTCQTAQ